MNFALNFERTVAIIKPHAILHRFAVIRRIHSAGFIILKVSMPEIKFLLILTLDSIAIGASCQAER